MKTRFHIASMLILLLVVGACKKSSNPEPGNGGNPDPGTPPANSTRLQLSLDSLYLYAKQTYLWYDAIPDQNTVNPRSFAGSNELASLNSLLTKLVRYKINPATNKPYEQQSFTSSTVPKFSYIEKGNPAQGIRGEVNNEGVGNDLGFGLAAIGSSKLYVSWVEGNSPADLAGVTRGFLITKINGSNVVYTSSFLNNALNGNTIRIEGTKPDSSTFDLSFTKKTYNSQPVLYKVIEQEGKKIGYFYLARFGDLNAHSKLIQNSIDSAFTAFTNAGVKNMIIDLRYNSGGYISTAQYIMNYIAPASLEGKVMYKEKFNDLVQNDRAPILKTIPLLDENNVQLVVNGRKIFYSDLDFRESQMTEFFKKKGALPAVSQIVFITSPNTASASELLINSFKPHLDVKIVGVGVGEDNEDRTYGKPVGFFGIYLDKYTIWMSQFTTVNSLDEGNYFDGFKRDMVALDDFSKNFGDLQEDGIKKAINYLTTGDTNRASSNGRMAATTYTERVRKITIKEEPIGMFERRVKLKK
jgi:carboxyl-terminal processing protease